MFTYVHLKNFLSFGNITFNLKKNSNCSKNFIAVYGENGSGKSNFVRSIELLRRTLTSFDLLRRADKVTEFLESEDDVFPEELKQILLSEIDIINVISSCRTIDCQEATVVEYGFLLNGHEGIYRIEFTDRISRESLYYFTGKQRGYLFDIENDTDETIKAKFNGNLFANDRVKQEFNAEIKKYWGRHTFLAIVMQQIQEKNIGYINESISEYLLAVINMLTNISVINKSSNRHNSGIITSKPDNILSDLRHGRINKNQIPLLHKTERVLRDFFTQAYADIKDIMYEINDMANDNVRYQLYVDKMIAGKIRHISFENESSGTQQILEIIRTLLGLFCGVTVVYDEIDNGIHDILLNQILDSIVDEITGQLIITTHNTMLLEKMDPHSAYVIQVDHLGNKEAHCITDYSVQSNNNNRIKYIKGLFGGTPYIDGIDYSTIINEIEKEEAE
ncbi:MAG: AAA family ATPase [Clostridia bacterium]|nr:AAA family ATPase [Clostridia bacterium]